MPRKKAGTAAAPPKTWQASGSAAAPVAVRLLPIKSRGSCPQRSNGVYEPRVRMQVRSNLECASPFYSCSVSLSPPPA